MNLAFATPPVIQYATATANVVFEGNSLVAGIGATTPMPAKVQALPPVSGNLTVSNQGVNGWNIANLDANSSAIDALYVAGKSNVLVIWEGTNQIFGIGDTGIAAASKMQALIAKRLTAHPWSIMVVTTLPRESTFTATGTTLILQNSELIAYDNQLRANWKAWGAKGITDVRQAGSVFANVVSPYSDAAFDSIGSVWDAGTVGYRVHLNDAGYLIVANMVAASLRRLPSR